MSTAQVSRDPPLEAAVELGVVDGVDEKRVVDGVERFTDVDRDCCRAERRFRAIEAYSDTGGGRKEGSSSGVSRAEAVLGRRRRRRERGGEKREETAFENFRGRAKEGNRAVGGGQEGGFTGFGNRDDKGLFPDTREVRFLDREVKEGGEVGDGASTEVL